MRFTHDNWKFGIDWYGEQQTPVDFLLGFLFYLGNGTSNKATMLITLIAGPAVSLSPDLIGTQGHAT